MFFALFFELRWSAIHGYQILRVFFPTISTFGCFWSQWPTSLAVTSGREGVRTTSFKPWQPHRGSCRGATAIEENNGSRREQWLTSLTVWTVHSICTYMIFIYIDISLLCEPNDAVRAVAVAKRREYIPQELQWLGTFFGAHVWSANGFMTQLHKAKLRLQRAHCRASHPASHGARRAQEVLVGTFGNSLPWTIGRL